MLSCFLDIKFVPQIWSFWLFWTFLCYKYRGEGFENFQISHQIWTRWLQVSGHRYQFHQNRSRNANFRAFCDAHPKVLIFPQFWQCVFTWKVSFDHLQKSRLRHRFPLKSWCQRPKTSITTYIHTIYHEDIVPQRLFHSIIHPNVSDSNKTIQLHHNFNFDPLNLEN